MRTIFRIRGLDCAEEVAALRAEIEPLAGIHELSFDVLNAKMIAYYDESQTDTSKIILAVARTGMSAQVWQEQLEAQAQKTEICRWGRTATTIASGILVITGFLSHALIQGLHAGLGRETPSGLPPITQGLYLLAIIAGAWYVAPKAWIALKRLRPDMNLLMTVAVLGAIGIGEYFEAATVSFLFALSLALESWSVGRARRAIAALIALSPPQALIIRPNGREELVPVADVPVGSHAVVRPGEKFPLDGRITKGQTSVNQAPITGESMPAPKGPGEEVFAGTINEEGAVEFETTRPATDTTLARIIRMVSEAQGRRAASEQWVERFARHYTPSVMILAILVAVFPPLVLGGTWSKWFYESLVLLVIACPCALVISTPVSIVAALAAAARHGVLIKGGVYVELPARLQAIAFDKTGTLTEGRPQVQQIVALSGHAELEVLEMAARIESRSEHPLARAIISYAAQAGIHPEPAQDFQALRGRGAVAKLDGKAVWLGSHRLLEERGQETPEIHEQLETLSSRGMSAVVLGKDEHVCGFIAVGDEVRSNIREVIAATKSAGVNRIIMLTGDNQGTAAAVAMRVGVDEVRAELLPEDKVATIEELVAEYGTVAMVGDGVNDAPAMARASLGIAMGAMGTDVAIETADIALMTDDVSRVPWLIHHSRRTLRIIRQNIVASLGVKAAFVLLTFVGYASLWAAIAADMGVSLVVVFNALRLLGRDAGAFGRSSR